jgi:hypothetical protein
MIRYAVDDELDLYRDDLDYRCRDSIRTWLVGLPTQQRASRS